MIRMGLVGAGAIAAEHSRAMAALPDVTLSMVYNPRPARAQELAARHGAIACATLEQLIAGVDAVDICSPTNVHAEQAIAALGAGKHVLCEKPIALSVADGERMVAAASAAGTVFLVAHVLRFWPEYRVVQRLIAAGDLGAPRAAVSWRLNAPCLHRPWYYRPEQSGGAVVDLLIHDLDLYHWLFGPLGHVQAQGRRDDAGAWQHVQALLGYPGGVLATAEASFLMPVDYPPTFLLRVDLEGGCLEYSNRAAPGRTLALLRPGAEIAYPALPPEDGITAEIAYFAACVREGRQPEVITPRDAVEALSASLRVQRALDGA
jgi:predicted dehydrogenase